MGDVMKPVASLKNAPPPATFSSRLRREASCMLRCQATSMPALDGAFWCRVVYHGTIMAQPEGVVRQSISLPSGMARRVKTLAKRERTSANRVIVNLIETGLEAREREKRAFFELAERLANSSNAAEQKRIKRELARMTFGE
jgi:predicted DNA-binding protein